MSFVEHQALAVERYPLMVRRAQCGEHSVERDPNWRPLTPEEITFYDEAPDWFTAIYELKDCYWMRSQASSDAVAADVSLTPAASTSARFRAARERAGLSIAETAARVGISEASVWDLETYDDELMTLYSPAELQRFAWALSVAPRELVGTEERNDTISATELASAIREHCRARKMTVGQFGGKVGWDLSNAVDAPQLLLSDLSLDGIGDICRELGIDWQRFISGLSPAR
jgi:transcriptional regulator with XRE-family HTH domain